MRKLLSLSCVGLLFCGAGCIALPLQSMGMPADFGSTRVRVLPFGAPCALWLFQFRNGEILVNGSGPGTTPEQAAQDRKAIDEAGGVDLCAHGGKTGFQLVGKACLFVRATDGYAWDGTTAEEVIARMQQVNVERAPERGAPRNPFAPATGGGFGVTHQEADNLPGTLLFKTERGEVGILEMLEIVEDERGHSGDGKGYGLKFRYKMVRQPQEAEPD